MNRLTYYTPLSRLWWPHVNNQVLKRVHAGPVRGAEQDGGVAAEHHGRAADLVSRLERFTLIKGDDAFPFCQRDRTMVQKRGGRIGTGRRVCWYHRPGNAADGAHPHVDDFQRYGRVGIVVGLPVGLVSLPNL